MPSPNTLKASRFSIGVKVRVLSLTFCHIKSMISGKANRSKIFAIIWPARQAQGNKPSNNHVEKPFSLSQTGIDAAFKSSHLHARTEFTVSDLNNYT